MCVRACKCAADEGSIIDTGREVYYFPIRLAVLGMKWILNEGGTCKHIHNGRLRVLHSLCMQLHVPWVSIDVQVRHPVTIVFSQQNKNLK